MAAAATTIEGQTCGILDGVPMGMAFLDPQGVILESNSKLRDLTGRGRRELVGTPALELVHHEDKQSVTRPFRALARRADSIEIEPLRLVAPDGTVRRVRLRAGAVRGSTGQVERFAVVIDDAEARMDLENSLIHDQAQAASRAKDELLTSLGHEVRTPINAIVGFAQLLLRSQEMQSASASRQWVQRILEAGWHLLAMTQETLELGRLEAGCLQVSVAPVEIAPIVDACVQMLRCCAAEQQVTLEEARSPSVAVVMADATRLKQVLLNLISNAIKYNRAGGHVVLDAKRWDDGSVDICVSDTGIGMTADQLAMLFEPFNRLGRESSNVEGTGVGLFISRRLTELMGGSMIVRSVAGVGTMVTIRLRTAESGRISRRD